MPEQFDEFKCVVETILKEYQPTFHDLINKRDFVRYPDVNELRAKLVDVLVIGSQATKSEFKEKLDLFLGS